MKILKLLGAIALIAIAATLFWLRTPGGAKVDEPQIRNTAKSYDARVIRDNWGVAHIFGKTDPDTSFGLGYSHAEDDWKTIQDVVLAARGKSAQYHGKDVAPADYLYDLFKVEEAVEQKAPTNLRSETRAMAKAYADGLNLYAIENPGKTLPGLLPVTEKDVLAGFTWATPFFFRMDETISALFAAEDRPSVSPWKETASLLHGMPETVIGSNAFAIAPSRSDDGHTRLILNSHQPFEGPYAWFEAHVVSESGYNVAGAGFPGTPMLTQGVTPHHGWAQTVNRPDLIDIYALETDKPKKPVAYKLDGEWVPFEKSKSRFRVKLFGPFSLPVTRDVLWSKHGPVLDTPTGYYALRFSGMQAVGAVEQWYDMGKAQSFAEWKEALARNDILSFNMVYADKNGNIGVVYNAKMPDRIEGPDWLEVLPGDKSELIWDGFREHSDLPQINNPECGWVFSANSTPFRSTDPDCDNAREDYSETFGIETRMTNRARQALEQFVPDQVITRDDLYAYRANGDYHEDAQLRQMVAKLLSEDFSDRPVLKEAQDLLAGWDGSTELDNRATALAVLTGMRAMGYEYIETLMEPVDALQKAVDDLNTVYGRIDPEWGEVNRLRRGEVDLPLRGGPDTLRAIYGQHDKFVENKGLKAVAGDTHIMIADWDPDGNLILDSIHQFGAATLDETSPHYADQAPLFAQETYKRMPMTLEEVLPLATRDYRPGQ